MVNDTSFAPDEVLIERRCHRPSRAVSLRVTHLPSGVSLTSERLGPFSGETAEDEERDAIEATRSEMLRRLAGELRSRER